jgi:hypothetical protein
MSVNAIESRRSFLRAIFGTGAAAMAVSACQLAVGGPDRAPYQVGVVEPAEVVPLRPGVLYANVMPSHVAGVRRLPSAGSIYAN